jgi:[acyl-carrier-protein] S-malonyltransferase
MKIAVLFPGQGSQFLGMGQEFIESSSDCREIMECAEKVCGTPLGDLCQNGPMEELTHAINLQPAITAVNLMCWQMLKERVDQSKISCFAGHSLGEYSALFAADVLSVEDTLRLVAKRGALMWREGQKNPGGMRAVLGKKIDEIEYCIEECKVAGAVTAANHNTPEQIVISGDIPSLDMISEVLENDGGKVIPLNVSIANHSPLVAGAVPEFAEFMGSIDFSKPQKPVIFNVTAQEEGDVTTIKDMMARQIISRVRWYESIMAMIDSGVDTFIEAGPKSVLKGLMRKIVPKGTEVTTLQFDSPAGLEKCIEKLQ